MANAPAYAPWDAARAEGVIAAHAKQPGATLPVLHALQETFGYIHGEAIPLVATALNLSRAEIVGVVNFYHDFRQEPPGRHIVQVCRAEACQAMGSDALAAAIEGDFGTSLGATTTDGEVTLGAVYCLGNCALAPAVMVDGRLLGRASAGRVRAAINGGAR